MKKAKQFFLNTVLLTATSLLMRGVGVTFQVYLSRKIGSTGIGLFQLVMSVYMLSITLAVSGIRLAVTRMVAEEMDSNTGARNAGVRRVMAWCVGYSLFFGVGAGVLLYHFAPAIGNQWLGDGRTILSLRILALSLPFLAVSGVFSGYFTAVRRVVKRAVTQVLEQFVKIVLTVLGLAYFAPKGLEAACAIIVAGTTLGEVFSLVMLFVLYLADRPGAGKGKGKREREPGRNIPGRMLGIALPVAVSTYVRSGLSTTLNLLIPRKLQHSGISSETALTTYGVINGMVMPVILFPSALLYTVAELLVPELAECRARGNLVRQNYIIGRVFQVTFLFSIGVTGILYAFSGELGVAIYGSENVSYFIRILAPLVPAMYLDASVDGMLKGVGEQVASMRYNILDSATGILLTLTLIPRFAIGGYLITIFVTETMNFAFSAHRLIRVTEYQLDLFSLVAKPLAAIVGSIFAARFLFGWLPPLELSASLLLSVQIGVVCGVYFVLLALLRCITREDAQWVADLFR